GKTFCIILLTFCIMPAWAGGKAPCDNIPELIIGQCFKVHGRLSSYNGNPAFRIWVVGTNHLLGVSSWWIKSGEKELPDNIYPLLPSSDFISQTAIFGDYEVCPLTEEHTGWMQSVCIKSASYLVSVPRK